MKIAIDGRVLMTNNYSGVPEATYNLLSALLALDHSNEYLVFYNSARPVVLPDFTAPNLRYIRTTIPNKILNYLLFSTLGQPKISTLLREKVDLWFMPHLNFIALDPSLANILTVHDLSFLRYPEFFSARKNFWHRAINAPRLITACDQVIAMSEHTKRDLLELTSIDPLKVQVIYGAAAPEFRVLVDSDPSLELVRHKFNLPKRFIFSLATIEPRKNLLSLISAYELLKAQAGYSDLELIIAGARGWKSTAVYQAAANSRYSKQIRFLNYIDRSEQVALYNLASVFAFPSYYEGFGIPPLEALACACPVVASWGTSLSEVLADAALLINPYDPSDLVEALNAVLTDQDLALKLRTKGLKQAAKFDWSKSAEQYLEIFKISQKN